MLRKENIIFEDSIYIVGGYDIERIKNKILELAERMIFELDLFSLEKIYIRRQLLLDDKLGMARGDKEICLSFGTAIKLALEDNHNDIRRRDALATFYHEGYHIYDFRQLMRKLILCCPEIQNEQSELSKGYRLWTEFFAVFSTFDICEQEHKYDSFENVFSKLAPNTDDCRYYASQIMGYWLHENHSPECDSLIKRYLNSDYIGPIRQLLQSMVNKYPNFMPDDLIELNNLFDKVISNQIDLSRYKILPIWDFFENLRNKSKN